MKDTVLNYDKLKGKIREYFKTNVEYAKYLGISEASLYQKFDYKTYFNQAQIIKTAEYCNMSPQDIYDCFFNQKV